MNKLYTNKIPVNSNRLYNDLSYLWPVISPVEDYEVESHALGEILLKQIDPQIQFPSLLELGAGSGHALFYLKQFFECSGVDISVAMLEQCQTLNPQVKTYLGDMRNIRLNEKFDAVIIHDAIDYMLTKEQARQAIKTASAHLDKGGILLVAPTYTRQTFQEHETAQDFAEDDEKQITYFSYVHTPGIEQNSFELILVYLIKDKQTGQVKIEHDRHLCGLFDLQFWQQALLDCSMELLYTPDSESKKEDDTLPYSWFIGVNN